MENRSNYFKNKPYQEIFHLGRYHARLVAAAYDDFYQTDLLQPAIHPNPGVVRNSWNLTNLDGGGWIVDDARYEFIGTSHGINEQDFFSNPTRARFDPVHNFLGQPPPASFGDYKLLSNNCQYHVHGVLQKMGLR